ncbi:twin-arginine translocase TatA/TatE family subunit [Microbacterium elymi]|uniref:Sec-independent protein translocase protein TatA n=1 Tax=Microbacterium elymi TaxID=2909587 RepID=A0ABY5NJT0_9MICO|nr:twin-arginine translocase TatA/TatE family subunit [Microbacterium elymi]UUT35425.1 twin-arginine translocase TatA/TatE family subunit [Microbacterium elymi]
MPNIFTGWHLLLILAVILLLFGAAKLPALAKSVGQSARVFKGEMKAMKTEDGGTAEPAADAPAHVDASAEAPPARGTSESQP